MHKLIEVITELQAISQTGLTFSQNIFDRERYKKIMQVAVYLSSLYSSKSSIDIEEVFYQDIGYITPKVAVRAAIIVDNKILLVKERCDGLWSLPGGWADVNLTPQENVIKEVKEETGYLCSVAKLMAIYDKRKNAMLSKWPHIYDLFFLCCIVNGSAKQTTMETSAMHFFYKDELPALSDGRVTVEQINNCFRHHSDASLPTDFN